jgi:hypothetical protein
MTFRTCFRRSPPSFRAPGHTYHSGTSENISGMIFFLLNGSYGIRGSNSSIRLYADRPECSDSYLCDQKLMLLIGFPKSWGSGYCPNAGVLELLYVVGGGMVG